MKHPNKKAIPMVNKRIAEMFIVGLSCLFGMGQFLYHRARGTPLAVLYDMHIFTMTRAYLGPKLSSMWGGTCMQGA
jgi:hypothetical protein